MKSFPWREWPAQKWGFSVSWDPEVDFCVHCLVVDGLQVPPFDRHADGDGRLRGAGLTAPDWNAWLEIVVEERALARAESLWPAWLRSPDWPPSHEALRAQPAQPRRAVDTWPGTPELKVRLSNLYERWTHFPAAARAEPPVERHPTELWLKVEPYRDRVPYFHIYPVTYKSAVTHCVPPASILLPAHALSTLESWHEATVQAVAELARLNDQA